MAKRNYSVTLEEEVVNKVQDRLQVGQKLSPMINHLLKKWLEMKDEE